MCKIEEYVWCCSAVRTASGCADRSGYSSDGNADQNNACTHSNILQHRLNIRVFDGFRFLIGWTENSEKYE